jgi:hypothetical protein
MTADMASQDTGQLRLQGGGYNKTIAIAGNFESNPEADCSVDVHFQNVPVAASLTLSYIAADGTAAIIVQNVTYQSLQDSSRQQ